MSYLTGLAALAVIIIFFIFLVKICLKRYQETDFSQTVQPVSPLGTRLPYNPDPLQGANYFPTGQRPHYPPVITSGAHPGAFNFSQGMALSHAPTIPTTTIPDLPPSYIVASELLDPPPSYSEAVKPR